MNMSSVIPVIVRCPKIGCPRSVSYCHTCDDMKGIEDNMLTCGWSHKSSKSANAAM
jgi:NCAIR mutase (PurE)-related protein